MGRSQRSRTRQCVCAIARVALAFGRLPPLGGHGAVPQPEPPTDRLMIQLRDAAAKPRATTPTAAAPTDRIEALAIRTATAMRYVRTLYRGAVSRPLGGVDPANATVLAAPTPIAAPVIPPAVANATSTPSSTSGGGGADAPWAILTLLAAGVIRVSGEQAA
jgi:hypothetical protein